MKNFEEVKNNINKARINVPSDHNPLIKKFVEQVNSSEEIKTLWHCINVNAIERLEMTDHGPVHFQIVSNIALRLCRILNKHGVELSVQKDHGLSYEHGELVVILASLFHDLGMSINRDGHEEFSLIIASRLLDQMLDFLPTIEKTIVKSEALHAIISHRSGGTPYTIEGGIVRVADALDMAEGRSRLPYEAGIINMHSLSHAAIDSVDITEGEVKPIKIDINMNNSSGLFQIDELLNKKVKGSGLEKYVSVKATISRDTEESLLKEFVF